MIINFLVWKKEGRKKISKTDKIDIEGTNWNDTYMIIRYIYEKYPGWNIGGWCKEQK
jgi:hypothetical protein